MTHDEQIKALMETIKSQKQTHAALIKKLKNYNTCSSCSFPKSIGVSACIECGKTLGDKGA